MFFLCDDFCDDEKNITSKIDMVNFHHDDFHHVMFLVCKNKRARVRAYAHAYARVRVCVYAHARMRPRARVYARAYTRTRVRAHTRTHTRARLYIHSQPSIGWSRGFGPPRAVQILSHPSYVVSALWARVLDRVNARACVCTRVRVYACAHVRAHARVRARGRM
jgi:hypothetical protein